MGIGLGFLLAEIVSKHEMEWITTAKGSNPSKHTKGISVPPLDSKCLEECVIIVTKQLEKVSLQSLATDQSESFKKSFELKWKERFGNYRTDVFGLLSLALTTIKKSSKWKPRFKADEGMIFSREKMFGIGIVKEVAERFVSSARLLNGLNPPPARTNAADVNQSVSAMVLAYDTCETS